MSVVLVSVSIPYQAYLLRRFEQQSNLDPLPVPWLRA